LGILQRLGPGLIIAGSIVGSGELIGTTKTGAEAGFWLLWLIMIGCVIKVFCQVELGRYTIISGKTTLNAFGDVPGPRVTSRANWLTVYWLAMFLVSLGQLGGIVGGVGQALQMTWPLTESGQAFNVQVHQESQYAVLLAERKLLREAGGQARRQEIDARLAELGPRIIADRRQYAAEQLRGSNTGVARQALREFESRVEALGPRPELVLDATDPAVKSLPDEVRRALFSLGKRSTHDPQLWATIIAVITAILLVLGRYGLIQNLATFFVASFTLVTVVNVGMLQFHPTWSVSLADLIDGLSFRLPPGPDGAISTRAIGTALATFGIIGVGANELIQYPYWCVEKGYARFTGPRENTEEWAVRARGWMHVMRWDAWCSMVIYTFATLAFYLLGAAILGRTGLNPSSSDMIRTLLVMYEPVFGAWAKWVFLFGAFAVLYSTFFVATAGHSRVFAEALQCFGIGPRTPAGYQRTVRALCGLFPFVCLLLFVLFPTQPERLILLSGVMQGIMLPMLACSAIYFRYRRGDVRIAPGQLWDCCLWLSAAGLLITGLWTVWTELTK
jgi:Mn2+/Fe2+ NRAMP family transporter